MTTTLITQTMSSVNKMLETSADNLQRLDDPDARKLNAAMSIDRIGSSGALRTHIKLSRNTNPMQEKIYVEQITLLEAKETKTNFLSRVESIIGGGANTQDSKLSKIVNEFFQSAKTLQANVTLPMRQAFIDKAKNIGVTLTAAADKITDLRLEADKSLKNATIDANNTIKSLFNLNNEMSRSSAPIKLYDQRDILIHDLATHFDIKISYGNSGIAQVLSSNGDLILSNESYAQFTYDGILSKDHMLDNEDLPDINISQFDKAGNTKSTSIFASGGNSDIKAFTSGKWSSLMELRDKTLLDISGAIKTLTSNFTKQVNDAHNSSSPYPPKGFFESTIEVSGNQSMDWGSAFTIYALDAKGKQLVGGAGKLNPVNINMQNLQTSAGTKATVADFIAELNEQLDKAPSRERAAIGAILDVNNQQITGEYLLNNIQLKARSVVDARNNDSFTFELDLQGNSHFASKIEVLSVQTTDVGGANNQNAVGVLPSAFTLGKDQNVATNKAITVINAGANRVITVQIRITGDNGVVSTGTVAFKADAAAKINDRIAFDSTLARGVVNGFDHTRDNPAPELASHSGVATARLVDTNGNDIDLASGQKGKLVIESNNSNYRMVFQGGNLSTQFGFNDLFKYDVRTGALEVTQAIVDDINQLATAQVQKNTGDDVVHKIGDAQASGKLTFDCAFGGLAVNDTVTIDGVIFTFADPANAALEVQVDAGGDNTISLTNLKNAINAHPDFNKRIIAEFDGINNLTIKAFTAGESGNNINLSINLAGGVTVDYTAGVVANAAPVANRLNNNTDAALAGGTNKDAKAKIFSYNIEPDNKEMSTKLGQLDSALVTINAEGIVPESVLSLASLATIVTGILSNFASESKLDSDIAKTVLTQTDKLIKENSGIKRESEYLRALELGQLMNALAHLLSMIQSNHVKTQDIIFG